MNATSAPAQGKRLATVTITVKGGGKERLQLISLDAIEGLSTPFAVSLEVLARQEMPLLDNLGQVAVVELATGGQPRTFHGHVVEAMYLREIDKRGFVYRLDLVPASHFHAQGSNHRIFQEKKVRVIIETVLAECQIKHEFKLQGADRTLPYCVQFGESNFDFVSRLMEEEGFYYYYVHSKAEHLMRIVNDPSEHADQPMAKLRYNPLNGPKVTDGEGKVQVHDWQERASSGGEAKVTMRDHDFKKPQLDLETHHEGTETHKEQETIEVFQWPGRYWLAATGNHLSQVLLESRRAQRLRFEGSSHHAGFLPGYTCTLANHPHARYNAKYLVIEARTHISAENFSSGMSSNPDDVRFVVVPANTRFRAPQNTPRPIASGPETAIVTGPSGEEIHTDTWGRVTVQFYWDRKGKGDAPNSSCWIRVTQMAGQGSNVIPRVGQEVLVDFIAGNPDRPIIVGWVFNADNMPAYALPANKTVAVWQSKTYKKTEGVSHEGADDISSGRPANNQIKFEDKTGEEEMLLHAEKDMNVRIRNNQTLEVGKDVDIKVKKNRVEEVGENETITIKKNRKEEVKGTEDVTVTMDRTVKLLANDKLDVTKNMNVKSGDTITIEADKKIVFIVGTSKMTMEPAKVTIESTQMEVKATGTMKVDAPKTDVNGSANLKLTGGIVNIN